MLPEVIILLLLCYTDIITSTNHYILFNENAIIKSRVDSPFYLRDPGNLIKFLKQIQFNDEAEKSFKNIKNYHYKLNFHKEITAQLMQRIAEGAECAKVYVNTFKSVDYALWTGASLKRLRFPEKMNIKEHNGVPICTDYINIDAVNNNVDAIWNKLDCFKIGILKSLKIDTEEYSLIPELGAKEAANFTETVRSIALRGLLNKPKIWKFHMLASYYWRLVGEAENSLNCARIALLLAFSIQAQNRDIALLNLGIVLVKTGRLDDAEIIFNEAVRMGPNHSENYLALATLLIQKHNFTKAREYLQHVKKLNIDMYKNILYNQQEYMDCFESLDNKAMTLFGYLKYMEQDIHEIGNLYSKVNEYINKIINQQVPLASRYSNDESTLQANLGKRYHQYCNSRKSQALDKEETILFCDFYSDLQMQLGSQAFSVDLLEQQIHLFKSYLFDYLPREYHEQLKAMYERAKPEFTY